MSAPRLLAICVVGFFASIGPASAQSCVWLARALGISPDELVDGATYVRVGAAWKALTTSPADLGLSVPRTLQGVHVVRDISGQERDGVVIIKTGRLGPILGPSSRRVALVRTSYNTCNPSVSVSSVSGEVYDGFHDFGYLNYELNELKKLNRFHTAFGRDCKQRTDDDPGGWGRHYSNRAQFSYSEDVVDYGGYTAVQALVAKVGFGPAAAAVTNAPIGKIERQTEIKTYSTTVGFACIRVSVPYRDEGSFFRTNDLGGVPSTSREKRYWRRDG